MRLSSGWDEEGELGPLNISVREGNESRETCEREREDVNGREVENTEKDSFTHAEGLFGRETK